MRHVFFARIITTAPRLCSQCEDEVPEGVIAFRAKNTELWCADCETYERNRE